MAFINSNELTLAAVRSDIQNVLEEKFNVQDHDVNSFFGLRGSLDARGLVYLVLILEDRYKIFFTPEDMDEERFYTVEGMSEIVYSKLRT